MGFQYAVFLPSRATLHTIFLNKDRFENHGAGSKSMLPVKHHHSNKSHFCVSRISLGSQRLGKHGQSCGGIPGCKTVVSGLQASHTSH